MGLTQSTGAGEYGFPVSAGCVC